ncbi:MAG: sugar phosphate isomerase/epimerase [Acidobacteriia bacterium]|nr:sugar phosphate isomerase/epimerase [Terriglobia bacterium]
MMLGSRRSFLAAAAGLSLYRCSGPEAENPAAGPSAAEAPMKLSLSVRVAESFSDKRNSEMTIDELIDLAKTFGYEALCMRASQLGTHSPAEQIAEAREKIDAAGLKVSMVTGDFAVPSNNEEGPMLLRDITPYLDLADALDSNLIRVCMKKDEDIEFAQKSADEAAERGIRLAHQSHCASLFETVSGSLRVLEAVNRPNFGIIYEPANWFIAGEDYGIDAIRKMKPYLFNFYIQNHRLNPDGETAVTTWKKGPVPVDHIGVWQEGGIDVEAVFDAMHEVGYEGYITVHQAFGDIMPVTEAVRKSYEHLRPLAMSRTA